MDCSAAVAGDAALSHFAGSTYRPSLCEMRQVDMLLLAALACIQFFWPPPSDSSETAARGTLNVLVLVAGAWYVGSRNPFLPQDAWKLYVNVGSLLLAALAAVLTHYTLADSLQTSPGADQHSTSGNASAVRTGLSYAVFAGCILLMITLAVGFWTSAISAVRIDERLRQTLAQAKRHETASKSAGLPRLPAPSDVFSGRNDADRLARALGAGGTANPLLSAGRVIVVGGSNRAGDSSRQLAKPPTVPPPSRRTIVRLGGEQEAAASPRELAPALSCEAGAQALNPGPSVNVVRPPSTAEMRLSEAGDGSRASFQQMATRRRINSTTGPGLSGAGSARNSVASMPRRLENSQSEAAGARGSIHSPCSARSSLAAPFGRQSDPAQGSSATDPRLPRQLFSPTLLSSAASTDATTSGPAPLRPATIRPALPCADITASGRPLPRADDAGDPPHHLDAPPKPA